MPVIFKDMARTIFVTNFALKIIEDCGKPTIVQIQNNTKSATKYVWLTGLGDSLTTQNPAPFIYKVAGDYTITLKSYKSDCLIQDSKKIELEKPATPPNVITPNGDGKNDTFNVGVKLEILEIFNRWGQPMLKTNAYQNDWGKDIPIGTYYYYLKTVGGAECKGWVEVL